MAITPKDYQFSSSDTSKGTVSPSYYEGYEGASAYSSGNTLYMSLSSGGFTPVCTATPANGYVTKKWQYGRYDATSGVIDISNDENNPTGLSLSYSRFFAVFDVPPSQTITLTNNHDYIVMSNSSATATLTGTTLTITNAGKIDVIDLGIGTRDNGPCVMLVSEEGPSYVEDVPITYTVTSSNYNTADSITIPVGASLIIESTTASVASYYGAWNSNSSHDYPDGTYPSDFRTSEYWEKIPSNYYYTLKSVKSMRFDTAGTYTIRKGWWDAYHYEQYEGQYLTVTVGSGPAQGGGTAIIL